MEFEISRSREDVERAIAVEIADSQAMALCVTQALSGVAEYPLPVIPQMVAGLFPATRV